MKGHPKSGCFIEKNTTILNDRVNRLNDNIRKLNTESDNPKVAPTFGIDLRNSHKSNKSYKINKYAFNLLVDGVHPSVLLSK